jgi:hypothetical protein
MQRIILLAAVLANLLIVAPGVARTAAASTAASAPHVLLSASSVLVLGPESRADHALTIAARRWSAEASDSAGKAGEVVNGLLGALLLALSVMTLWLLGRRCPTREERAAER